MNKWIVEKMVLNSCYKTCLVPVVNLVLWFSISFEENPWYIIIWVCIWVWFWKLGLENIYMFLLFSVMLTFMTSLLAISLQLKKIIWGQRVKKKKKKCEFFYSCLLFLSLYLLVSLEYCWKCLNVLLVKKITGSQEC